jgi:hypothetical protein
MGLAKMRSQSKKIANAALELLSPKNPEVLCANAVQTFVAGT